MIKEEKKKSYGLLFALSLVLDLMVVFWSPSSENKIYYIVLVVVVIIKDVAYFMRQREIKKLEKHSINSLSAPTKIKKSLL